MSDLDRLLGEYIESYLAGERPDLLAYLGKTGGDDEREQLADLIDAFLIDAPRQPFDAEAYRGSLAADVVEGLERSLRGQAGLWPSVLPRLRHRARLKRGELVAQLAAGLGFTDAGAEQKVAGYYHEMEQGLLPARGVSEKVLEALGAIIGESAARLREAGEALQPGEAGGGDDAVFARTGHPEGDPTVADAAAATSLHLEHADRGELDEVDRLFLEG